MKLAVITSSPGFIPAASSARCNALVPEFTPTACLAWQYAANSASKASTYTNWHLSNTLDIASSISCLMREYCALRSTKGIIFFVTVFLFLIFAGAAIVEGRAAGSKFSEHRPTNRIAHEVLNGINSLVLGCRFKFNRAFA